jgi:ubiquinone/menaquinone biosynthesis C-methylase UbiE
MSNPAESYERDMVPALFGPLAGRLFEIARPARGERVLDVACGTGIVARRIALLVGERGKVVGLDPSSAMLDVARDAAAHEDVTIDWRQGNAEALPFDDARFDLALCQQGLMFFQDRAAGLAEMRRVLVPGGRVAVTVTQGLEAHPWEQRLDAAFTRYSGRSVMHTVFSMGDRDALAGLLAGAGFTEIEITPVTINARYVDPERYLETRIAAIAAAVPEFQQLDAAGRESMAAAIRAEMAEPVRSLTVDGFVINPAQILIARGRTPS